MLSGSEADSTKIGTLGSSARWPVPQGAVEILPAGAATTDYELWQQTRLGGLGGSDVPALVGEGFETLYSLWLTKTGRRAPIDDNDLMARGRYLEPAVCQWFADTTGLSLRRSGTWACLEYDPETDTTVPGWMRFNPDRLTSDGGILEVKCPNHADWGQHWRHGPAGYAEVQLRWGMAVLDVDHGYIAADGPQGLRWWRRERDLEFENRLVSLAQHYWMHNVCDDEPPDIDGSEVTREAIEASSRPPSQQLVKYAQIPGCALWEARRRALKRQIAACAAEVEEIENRFKAALLDAETAVDGDRRIIRWSWAALDSDSKAPYRKLAKPRKKD